MFLFCLVFAMFCARLFICASWSPAGKGLTSWLSFVVSSVSLSLSHWYPGSGVVLDCIDSWSLQPYLLLMKLTYFLYISISDRHVEKESLAEYIAKKREMFLVQVWKIIATKLTSLKFNFIIDNAKSQQKTKYNPFRLTFHSINKHRNKYSQKF